MKTLQQYISELMVCELSDETIISAAKKASGSRKGKFAEEALKRITIKLKNKGFELDDNACGDEVYPEYYFSKPQVNGLLFGVSFGDGKFEFWAYGTFEGTQPKGDKSNAEYIVVSNDKVTYSNKTHSRQYASTIIQFGKVFGITLDKNKILA